MRAGLAGVLAIAIVGAAILWIFAGGKTSSANSAALRQNNRSNTGSKAAPLKKRLYVGDSLLVPLGDDVYKIRLASISRHREPRDTLRTLQALSRRSGFDRSRQERERLMPRSSSAILKKTANRRAPSLRSRIRASRGRGAGSGRNNHSRKHDSTAQSPASPVADTLILKIRARVPYPFRRSGDIQGQLSIPLRSRQEKNGWKSTTRKGESIHDKCQLGADGLGIERPGPRS